MPRYAAVDIGSNSIRMMVADVTSAKTEILASDRMVTRLGAGVFLDGRIPPDALDLVCAQLSRMAQVFRNFQVNALRAVATSAVRDAKNQQEFLDRTREALGAPVETISGQEEARLIHLGVQSRWPQGGLRTLIIDVGGGSTEFILGDDGVLSGAFSKPLGAVRLTEVFLKSDPPTALELRQLDGYIVEKLAAPVRAMPGPFDRVVGTSASAAAIVSAINGLPRTRREEADHLSATTAQIRSLFHSLATRDLAARRAIPGIGPRRAEIIVAGAAVFLRSLEAFQHGSLYYSTAGLRDGIIADLAARGVSLYQASLNADQCKTVQELAAKYQVDLAHSKHVALLARQLFVGLGAIHNLPLPYGKLLEAAGWLHDIGHFVSSVGHHKHSQYLVANSDMPGFNDRERHVVAALCRYHRKAEPTPRHAFFQSVEAAERRPVHALTPLLRLADALDRGHRQHVKRVSPELRGNELVVKLQLDDDSEVDLWAATHLAELFRSTYDLPLTLMKVSS